MTSVYRRYNACRFAGVFGLARPRWRPEPRRCAPCPAAACTGGTGRCRRRWSAAACRPAASGGRAAPAGRRSPPCVQLLIHGFCVHPDAHGGNLKRAAQDIVPKDDVAVQLPVVIIGRAAVMPDAGLQLIADLHDKRGLVLFQIGVLPLLGGLARDTDPPAPGW